MRSTFGLSGPVPDPCERSLSFRNVRPCGIGSTSKSFRLQTDYSPTSRVFTKICINDIRLTFRSMKSDRGLLVSVVVGGINDETRHLVLTDDPDHKTQTRESDRGYFYVLRSGEKVM